MPTVTLGALEQAISSDLATTILAAVVLLLAVFAVLARRRQPDTAPTPKPAAARLTMKENAS